MTAAQIPAPAARAPARWRVRTPTVLQMEAVECGAACLAMVLGYFGRIVPLEELRQACGVSRDGTKASNIVRAAAGYGLLSRGFKKEPEQLAGLPLPMIIFWNFNHFVVLEGFDARRVYINDPAAGPRVLSREEFDQSFTGVVLVFEKAEGFVRGGRRASLLGALRPRLRGAGVALGFILLASLALIVPGLVVPSLVRAFVDTYLVQGKTSWAMPLMLGLGLAALIAGALTWLQQRHLLKLETRLALGSSSRYLWHVLRLPLSFFNQRYGGEVGGRLAINDSVAVLLSERLATTALSLILVVFYAALMLQYSVGLTLASIGVLVLNLVVLRYVARRRADGSQRLLQEQGKLQGVTMNGLQMIETLKATGAEEDFFARWSGYQAKVENSSQSLGLLTQGLDIVPPLLAALNSVLILGVGALLVMGGQLSVGSLVAYQALVGAFIAPVNSLVALGGALQEVGGSLRRLDDVLQYPTDPVADALVEGGPARLAGYLELRGLTFGYSRLDQPLIAGFDLRLRPGDRVALVGGSGSGKSTVARLVTGLFAPWSGEILLDGVPRDKTPGPALHNSLALVDQEIFLFEGTVRENVTLWDETIPEADIVAAAKDACIHEDLAARPGGYDSPVAEGGRNFSGGQRQRLEIARALVRNPSILILDEATSALDPITEKTVADNLRRRGCTCLIVAHRLSTIRDSDEIIVLERGKVVQRGAHQDLVAAGGAYARLIAQE